MIFPSFFRAVIRPVSARRLVYYAPLLRVCPEGCVPSFSYDNSPIFMMTVPMKYYADSLVRIEAIMTPFDVLRPLSSP